MDQFSKARHAIVKDLPTNGLDTLLRWNPRWRNADTIELAILKEKSRLGLQSRQLPTRRESLCHLTHANHTECAVLRLVYP